MDEKAKTAAAKAHFGRALEHARKRYGEETGRPGFSQRAFAEALGIAGERREERYRLYEAGEREPPLWILAAIRRVTGFSLSDMIAGLPPGRLLNMPPSASKPSPPRQGRRRVPKNDDDPPPRPPRMPPPPRRPPPRRRRSNGLG